MPESPDLNESLDEEAKRLIVDCVYSGRGHHEESSWWALVNTWLGLPTEIVTALVASGAAVAALAGAEKEITAVLALTAAVLIAIRAFVRADEVADSHAVKGNRYITIRNETSFFRNIEMRSGESPEDLVAKLRDLRERYNVLLETPPRRISRRAYEKAKKNIAAGESMYTNDLIWKELSQ